MENFDFIRLVNCEDNEKYMKKGFNQISNISFDSIGVAVLFGYLYQVITTKACRYGMQLLTSIEELQQENSFTSLKSSLFLLTKNFDISTSLFSLCSSPIVKDLQNLASSYFPQDSLLSLQRSLRKFSYQCNALIIVYYKDQIIEFNQCKLPSKIVVGVSIEEITRASLLLFDIEPTSEIEFRYPEVLQQIIEKSCEVIQASDNQTIFTEKFEKYEGVVPDFVLQQLVEMAKKTPKLVLKSAPKLGSLGNYDNGKVKNESRLIPLSCEETKNFLDKFMKNDSRFLRTKVEENKIKVKPPLNLVESQPFDFSNMFIGGLLHHKPGPENFMIKMPDHRCQKCRDEPLKGINLLHNCSLCDQCHYESVLTKNCLRCGKDYTEKELEELKLYFSIE